MASEATEMAVRGNMHMYNMVIKVPYFKSEFISPPRLFGGRHGLEAAKMAVRDNVQMDTRVIKVDDLKSEVILSLRPFGGRYCLRGLQNGCLRQYAHRYQVIQVI